MAESDVMRGRSSQPPTMPFARTVKLFLLSNYSDFSSERETFWSEVVPELQQHCLLHASELCVIDPMEGRSDANVINHDVIMHELDGAMSPGHPYLFVVMIGDKYGPLTLPKTYSEADFDEIRRSVIDSDVKLLDEWYRLDKNSIPPTYRLECENFKNRSQKRVPSKELVALIRTANSRVDQSKTKDKDPRFLQHSYIEKCAQAALSARDSHCCRTLFVLRKFNDIEKLHAGARSNQKSSVTPFCDVDDPIASDRLNSLKNKLSSTLDKPNLESFLVPFSYNWTSSNDRSHYLERFAQQITYKTKQLLESIFLVLPYRVDGTGVDMWRRGHQSEISLHTALLQSRRCKTLQGRKSNLEFFANLVKNSAKALHPPIAILAEEGFGKTAFLCEVAHSIHNWLGFDSVSLVPRFMGVSSSCCSRTEVLMSLCEQICAKYDIAAKNELVGDQPALAKWFTLLLEQVSRLVPNSATVKPLVILLDDLHLLKTSYAPEVFDWIPENLPPYTLIVYTATSLMTAKGTQVVDLPNLAEKVLCDLALSAVSECGRTLSPEQSPSIASCLRSTPSPLFASLLGSEAKSWASYSAPNGAGISRTVGGYVDQTLANLEKKYGATLVETVCSLLECTPYGLTETELMDSLSTDDAIMEVALAGQQDSGDKRVSRFPITLFLALKQELGEFTETISVDNLAVIRWKFSITRTVVRQRYLQTSLQQKRIHTHLADVLANLYHDPDTDGGITKLRRVMPRPLKVYNYDTFLYNVRRAHEQWYHLLHSGNIEAMKEKALCNFEYLFAVLVTSSLTHLLSITEIVMFQVLHKDFQILRDYVLIPSVHSVWDEPTAFAAEVIGRLRYNKDASTESLKNLVVQAMSWTDNYSLSPILVPLTCWIGSASTPLIHRFTMAAWSSSANTILLLTANYQHLLVSGERGNGSIRMYHVASQLLVKTFTGHTDRLLDMVLSSDGQVLFTCSVDKTIKAWDLLAGNCVKTLAIHTDSVSCLTTTKDGSRLVSGSKDQTVKITNLENGEVLTTLEGQGGPVHAIRLTEDSEVLITGSDDFNVRVWSMAAGKLISTLSGLMAPVYRLALTSNDAFLMVACEDETLHVFSLCSASQIHELREHEGKVCSLAVAKDDCQLFAGCSDGNVYVYDLHSKELLETRPCGSGSAVNSLAISSDGNFLASACGPRVQVWNIQTRKIDHLFRSVQEIAAKSEENPITRVFSKPPVLQKHKPEITAIAMSTDFKLAGVGDTQGFLTLWDVDGCFLLWRSHHEGDGRVTAVAFTTGSEPAYVLSATLTGPVVVWNVITGRMVKQYEGHKEPVDHIQVFQDNSRVFSHDRADNTCIWVLMETFQSTSSLSQPSEETQCTFKGPGALLTLLPNEKDIIGKASDLEKEARIWTMNSDGVQIRGRFTHVETVTCLCVTYDGRVAVTGSKDQSLKVWEVATAFLTQVLVGHQDDILCCTVSRDGRYVLSGSADCKAMYWDVNTGDAVHTLSRHPRPVTGVAVTDDRAVGLSVHDDGWAFAWSLESGEKIASVNGAAPARSIRCSGDASRITLSLVESEHFPILCLHNSPAILGGSGAHHGAAPHSHTARRGNRAPSISSTGSGASFGSGVVLGHDARRDSGRASGHKEVKKGSGTSPNLFANIQNNRSRASISEARVVVSSSTSGAQSAKRVTPVSGICTLL